MAAEILMVAGEASGDLHAARLMRDLSALRPDIRYFGLGSDEMVAAGLDALGDSREIAVVGLSEALRVLARARRLFHRILAECERRRPDLAVLVDAPDFNLRLAKRLHRLGIPVVYYISPQLWAWRAGRVEIVRRTVRRMLVLFPFEVEFYRDRGVDAVHVGHPLVDEVPVLPQAWQHLDDHSQRYLALLPGSRPSEVEQLLPPLLEVGAALYRSHDVQCRLILAPGLDRAVVQPQIDRCGVPVEVVQKERFEAIAGSHLAICASGTATLEVGLLGTPMLMVYRMSALTYRLGKILVRVPHAALVNLVLDDRVVPELIQREMRSSRLEVAAQRVLFEPGVAQTMCAGLAPLRERLGQPGASGRAAAAVLAVLAEEERDS